MHTRGAGRRAPHRPRNIGAIGEMSEGTSRVDYCIDRSEERQP
jgi:hypothetical protein